jgi:hypothetical protein
LSLPFESPLLLLAIALFFVSGVARPSFRALSLALAAALPAILLMFLLNFAVTHNWTTLPEQLGRYEYGVPTTLTIQPSPTPHVPLTPEQQINYRAQSLQHGSAADSVTKFLLRLEYRVRFYRFFFLPPLYLALLAFLFTLRQARLRWVCMTLAIFALGTNFFPYFLPQYLAGVTSLLVLASVAGLRWLSQLRIPEISHILIVLCLAEFMSWYTLHLFESPTLYPVLHYETWDAVNHSSAHAAMRQVEARPGQLLVFVRYSARHNYRNEWVWNAADIDAARIVYARDLGPVEDEQLIRYYPNRKVLLLEPDAPQLSVYDAH